MKTKSCKTCGRKKRLALFYRYAAMVDGHLNHCKPCLRRRARSYRARNLARVRAHDRVRSKTPAALGATVARVRLWRQRHR